MDEIRDLLHAYCRAADRNDPDALAACFTEDCLCDYGPGATTSSSALRTAG